MSRSFVSILFLGIFSLAESTLNNQPEDNHIVDDDSDVRVAAAQSQVQNTREEALFVLPDTARMIADFAPHPAYDMFALSSPSMRDLLSASERRSLLSRYSAQRRRMEYPFWNLSYGPMRDKYDIPLMFTDTDPKQALGGPHSDLFPLELILSASDDAPDSNVKGIAFFGEGFGLELTNVGPAYGVYLSYPSVGNSWERADFLIQSWKPQYPEVANPIHREGENLAVGRRCGISF